jgi:hypothetical protein
MHTSAVSLLLTRALLHSLAVQSWDRGRPPEHYLYAGGSRIIVDQLPSVTVCYWRHQTNMPTALSNSASVSLSKFDAVACEAEALRAFAHDRLT